MVLPRSLRHPRGMATAVPPDDTARLTDLANLTARVKRLTRQVADLRRGVDKLEADRAADVAEAAKS